MAPTDAVRRATKKYLSEKVDSITIRVPKGQKEIIEKIAASKGLSLNAYINQLIGDSISNNENESNR